MKKGQGLSMNVIIIAAIALLILVILSVFVLRTGSSLDKGLQCYSLEGATCEDMGDCPSGAIHERSRDASCSEDGEEWCCIPLG